MHIINKLFRQDGPSGKLPCLEVPMVSIYTKEEKVSGERKYLGLLNLNHFISAMSDTRRGHERTRVYLTDAHTINGTLVSYIVDLSYAKFKELITPYIYELRNDLNV